MIAAPAAIQLRPYQELAIRYTLEAINRGDRRCYYALPTGCGKSLIASHLARPFSRCLYVAHRKELIDQLAERLRADWPERSVGVVMAEKDEKRAEIVVATQQSLHEARAREVLEAGSFELLFVDEAHHVTTGSSYERLLEYLASYNPELAVVGCTATPFRADAKRMQDVLPRCVFARTIDDMQREGWLCPLRWVRIRTEMDLASVRTTRSTDGPDYDERELATLAEDEAIIEVVVRHITARIGTRPTVVFGCSVRHAQLLAQALNEHGVRAAAVWGVMRKDERRAILALWRAGDIQVVCNVGVLTEGFDFPEIGCVTIARPTQSPGLYLQMLGRGTRVTDGKDDCLVLDVSGNEPISETRQVLLPDVASVSDAEWEAAEHDEPLEQIVQQRMRTIAEGRGNRLTRDPSHDAVFRWLAIDHGYALPVGGGISLCLVPDPRGSGLYHLAQLNGDGSGVRLSRQPDVIWEQQKLVLRWVERQGQSAQMLGAREQAWHHQPPSEKQIRLLQRMAPETSTDGLTRVEVSDLISTHLVNRHAERLLRVWEI